MDGVVPKPHHREVRVWLSLLLLGVLACELPGRTDMVGRRTRARMSANELHNLGLDALNDGRLTECVAVMNQVLRRKRLPAAYGNLAVCSAASGQLGAAREALERHPEPDHWAVQQVRGLIELASGQSSAARAALERAPGGPLAAALEGGAVASEHWPAAAFSAVPTPRQAPRGIMGN